MRQAGHVLAGRYLLERHIADGGMGEIWAARHQALKKPVAIKLMRERAAGNPTLRTRFEREAQVGARLRTPHVVEVFDYGVEDDIPFLVMELLEGEDLSELGAREKPFSLRETVTILTEAARGLAAAHEEGVIHRDVKPSNLFVAKASAGQRIVKVLDFGIAKLAEEQKLTEAHVILGSPSYISPEQIRGQAVGPATDVWGLSIVAFWMLSGELPFRGPTAAALADRIVAGDRSSLTEIALGLPDAIDDIFERGLALDPSGRYASPLELMEDLWRLDRSFPDLPVARSVREMPTDRHPVVPDVSSGPTAPDVDDRATAKPEEPVPISEGPTADLMTLKMEQRTVKMAGPQNVFVLPRAEAKTQKMEPGRGVAALPRALAAPHRADATPDRTDRRPTARSSSSALWWLLPLFALVIVVVALVKLLRG